MHMHIVHVCCNEVLTYYFVLMFTGTNTGGGDAHLCCHAHHVNLSVAMASMATVGMSSTLLKMLYHLPLACHGFPQNLTL